MHFFSSKLEADKQILTVKLYDCTTFFKNGMKMVIELGNHKVWWATWRRAEGSTRLDPQTLREIVFLLALPLLMPIPFEVACECRPKLNDDDDEAINAIIYSSSLHPRHHCMVCTNG